MQTLGICKGLNQFPKTAFFSVGTWFPRFRHAGRCHGIIVKFLIINSDFAYGVDLVLKNNIKSTLCFYNLLNVCVIPFRAVASSRDESRGGCWDGGGAR